MPPKKKKSKAPEKSEEQKNEDNEIEILSASVNYERSRNERCISTVSRHVHFSKVDRRLTKEYDAIKRHNHELEIKLSAQSDKKRQIGKVLHFPCELY